MKTITMPVTDRPHYLKQTLNYLSKNDLTGFKLFINVEPMNDKCIEMCRNISFIETDLKVNKTRMKHFDNPYDLISRAFNSGSDFNVHFDDDLAISPDAINLVNWYYNNYKDKPLSHITYSLFNYESDPTYPNKLTEVPKFFMGLGWCIFKEQWEAIHKPNWYNYEVSKRNFTPQTIGWDWVFSGIAKEKNLSSIIPKYSRTNHLGREGGTYCDANFHDSKFANLKWNEDKIIKEFILEK